MDARLVQFEKEEFPFSKGTPSHPLPSKTAPPPPAPQTKWKFHQIASGSDTEEELDPLFPTKSTPKRKEASSQAPKEVPPTITLDEEEEDHQGGNNTDEFLEEEEEEEKQREPML